MGNSRHSHSETNSAPRRPWAALETTTIRLNRVLRVLRTGAPWSALPERYPSSQTCHRRFQQWVRPGIMRGILEALAEELRIRGRLDVREAFIDGSFAPAKKGIEGRQNETWQGNENYGRRRQPWPPSCRVRRKRFTSRSEIGHFHACPDDCP